MLKRNILSIILLFAAINVSAQTYSGGTGTYSNPYLISSKADMVSLANTVNNGTNTYEGKFFRLTKSLTGANALTTSVGVINSYAFRGVFNGNGYEVELNNAQGGVFDNIYNATIQNLDVKGTISNTLKNVSYVGGICGHAYNSTIAYCNNTASLTFINAEHSEIGGICGNAEVGTIITDCFNSGKISTSSSYYLIGGICGSILNSTILNSYNVGNISVNSTNYYYTGGICGYGGSSLIKNCFSANANIEVKIGEAKSGNGWRIVGTLSNILVCNNNYALSTMTINGSIVNSSNTDDQNGAGATLANFKSQSWIQTTLGWDFNAIWQMSSSNSVNQGFPIIRSTTKPIQYNINAKAGNNGSISSGGDLKINQGGSKSYTFMPNSGFQIYQVLIDGSNNSQAISSGTYTFAEVSRNHTIEVSFCPLSPPIFSGGSGTHESPYLISSKADMVALADAVEGGNTYEGKFFRLTKSLTGENIINRSVEIGKASCRERV